MAPRKYRRRLHIILPVQSLSLIRRPCWSKGNYTSQEQRSLKLKPTARIDSSLSTHLELETRTKTSNHQTTVASTKNETTTLKKKKKKKKKKRKRKRAYTLDKDDNFCDSDVETIDVYYDDDVDDDKENKAIQLAILASLNVKHKEEEEMKGDDSEMYQ